MTTTKTSSRPLPEEVETLRKKLPKNAYGTSLLSALLLWWNGYDLRDLLPRSTFFRFKRKLLTYGFDISGGHQ
ncbi:hypothetical protein KIP69_08630 [Geobacter sulfurreducens]|uniref:phage/plasmid replication domain-containing protein n=1 Tax=Geobacter sulfurreducens TaxID=35554 RepID=UPI001BDD2EB0|nr:phage/plasmid replication protein [Geobacter sulfurreducens]QVW33680.1 hypothetical protein KIP69_08630 [Geobacter sulfurreducens]